MRTLTAIMKKTGPRGCSLLYVLIYAASKSVDQQIFLFAGRFSCHDHFNFTKILMATLNVMMANWPDSQTMRSTQL